jgi:hypothetical protein
MAEFFLRNEKNNGNSVFRDFKLRNFSLMKNGTTMAKKTTILNYCVANALDLLKNQEYLKI